VGLLVIRPGVWTTVQDRGRVGFRGFGVPVGGAFDVSSLDLANALVGNDRQAAALEFTLIGGTYRAEIPLAIALAGAPMSVRIRSDDGPDRTLRVPQSANLQPEDVLIVGGSPFGARTYLAVGGGGFRTPLILGSRSSETRLQAGDLLEAEASDTPSRRPVAWPWGPHGKIDSIRIIDGPDAHPKLGDASLLESNVFRISTRSDRMGLRLEGPTIRRENEPARPSCPIAPGAIQLTGGQAIILGVAGGTMGGYVDLAHVITADLHRLAQFRPGDPITFEKITIEQARTIDRQDRQERDRWLALIRSTSSD
jgi:biotin-dependent carboxylase-like uncharacterized protein